MRRIRGMDLLAVGEKYAAGREICESPRAVFRLSVPAGLAGSPGPAGDGAAIVPCAHRELGRHGGRSAGGDRRLAVRARAGGVSGAGARGGAAGRASISTTSSLPGHDNVDPAGAVGRRVRGRVSRRSGKRRWMARRTTTTARIRSMRCKACCSRATAGKSICCPPGRRTGTCRSSYGPTTTRPSSAIIAAAKCGP